MNAGRAFAWEFGRGHRIGLVALTIYTVAFYAIRAVILGPGHPMRIAPPNGLAAFLVVPMTFAGAEQTVAQVISRGPVAGVKGTAEISFG